jgi:competence protein ComEC
MLERPLLIPLCSLIAGLCAADSLGAISPHWVLPALILTTLAACFVKGRFPFLLSLSLLFFVWGTLSLEPFLNPHDQLGSLASERPVKIEGVVDARPEGVAAGDGRVYLRVERLYLARGDKAVTGRLLVYIKEGRAQLFTGDRVLFTSRIRKPRMYGLPGEIDYPRRLAYNSVFATAFVKEASDLVLLRGGEGWRHDLDVLAASLGNFITAHAPRVEGGVLKALLLGDRSDVPDEVNGAYARSGVNHILSISGFHVGIIFLCMFQLLFLLARRSEFLALHLNLRRVLLVLALPVVVFYLFLSGLAPATVRSVIMIAAVIAALHIRREVDPVNSVMLAACAILLATPEVLFDVSFQLSFLAIWGLIVLAPPLAAPFAGAGILKWLLLLVAASAAAILATLVPVAYYFHQVSFIGLLANLVIVPLMGYGAVLLGFASLPLSFIAPSVAGCLVTAAAFLVRISDSAIDFFARAPVITSYAPERLDLLIACLILCALTFMASRRGKYQAVAVLLAILVIRAVPAGGTEDDKLRIYFLSVGQGDATLLRLPEGKWMLVDGGGSAGGGDDRVGARLLLPALARLGVKHLDYLVLTHEHPDHLQGVLYLARHFDVREFWETGVPGTTREYQELKWVLVLRGIPTRVINASMPPVEAGGAKVEPLWPLSAAKSLSGDANDSSLVFRLRHGGCSVLFTGDLGEGAEREILARGVPLKSSLLKVAHHGSKYSSTDEFLDAVSPRVAVISAGYDNPFHLPAPSTVARLLIHGIRIYRTDLDGTVEGVCGPDGALSISTPWGHFN